MSRLVPESRSVAAGAAASQISVKDAIDVLVHDDNDGQRKRKTVLELITLVQKTDFAEQFLEEDGLDVLLQQIRNATGNMQAAMLGVLRGLLVYLNAVEQITESPDFVDRIYGLIVPPPDGSAVPLNVAKPTLEILIVLCGMSPTGYKLINKAAKKRIGANLLPYAPLIPLLGASDLLAVHSTVLLMNILMKKMKEASELKAKKLFFRWKECGVISLLKPLTAIEDGDITKQLAYFQKQTNFTIPRSWEEASKYKAQYEEARRKCDMATETLYIYQQQQAKMRMLKSELARAQETVRALSLALPSTTVTYHPSRRFHDGGGIPLAQLASTSLEPINPTSATSDLLQARKQVLEHFLTSDDIRPLAQKLVGPVVVVQNNAMPEHYDLEDEDDLPPPPEEDEEDMLPPPMDDDDMPPPPPDDDDMDAPPPFDVSHEPRATAASGAPPVAAQPQPPSQKYHDPAIAVVPPPQGPAPGATGSAPPPSLPTPAAAAPSPAGAPPPPPPPPPPGFKGGPPPPPPMFGKKGPGGLPGKAAPKRPEKQYFTGPAPTKKMKPLHWDKVELPEQVNQISVWHRIHNGSAGNLGFDYQEFEHMFSQKEVEVKSSAAPPKPKKVMLLPDDVNRNLSIVLHKLPSIPNVQRALLELDTNVLTRDALTAMLAHAPQEETKSAFLKKASLKAEEEYEPQEKYMAMMITMPDFKHRVSAWLFSMEWEDSRVAVQKPILRLQEAMSVVLDSKHLPYYLGLLLGFGNMMNYGDMRKGNAGAVQLSLLGKLEMTKDNRGKISLLSHLVTTVKKCNPDALHLVEELKPLQTNIQQIKWEDIEKATQEAERALEAFKNQCSLVKKRLVAAGTDAEDPFIPFTMEFGMRAESGLNELKAQFELLDATRKRFLAYFGIYDERRRPEEVFAEVLPFLEKIKKAVQDIEKETRRNAKKGQKLGNGQLSNVVEKLQEEIAV